MRHGVGLIRHFRCVGGDKGRLSVLTYTIAVLTNLVSLCMCMVSQRVPDNLYIYIISSFLVLTSMPIYPPILA